MTSPERNPYAAPGPARPPPPERLRHPHQLARFYLLALAALAISGLCGLVAYLVILDPFHDLTTPALALRLGILGTVALLGLVAAAGLVLAKAWGWYAALAQYLIIGVLLIALLVGVFVAGTQAPLMALVPVVGVILVLAVPVALLLDRVTRLLLGVRWPRWLAPGRDPRRRAVHR